jgi:hypothetical protein
MLKQLPAAEFPLTASVAAELGAYGSDAHYEFALDQLLGGLQSSSRPTISAAWRV